MAEWAEDLGAFLTAIWAEIGNFSAPRGGYPGLITLATQGDNGPEQRMLVLRSADRAAARLVLHTDKATAKVTEIEADPRVSLLIWCAKQNLQLRLKGQAELLGAYAAQQAWGDMPFASQGNYGVTPAPGTVISSSGAYERLADPARLAVIAVSLHEIDAVHLGQPHHIRARFRAKDGWSGAWLAP